MAHPQADKFVPGSVWNDNYQDFEVLDQKTDGGGYLVKLLKDGKVVGHGFGWKQAHDQWTLVREAPAIAETVEVLEPYEAWKERMMRESLG